MPGKQQASMQAGGFSHSGHEMATSKRACQTKLSSGCNFAKATILSAHPHLLAGCRQLVWLCGSTTLRNLGRVEPLCSNIPVIRFPRPWLTAAAIGWMGGLASFYLFSARWARGFVWTASLAGPFSRSARLRERPCVSVGVSGEFVWHAGERVSGSGS
ncbi:hypothetical protein HDK77DRAFT_263986 [Phyllosticta capitalensis]|uniref:Uncharacterized protein n=1 Tax=Phyllosticta capitalensis TaxID=121624 RepID=A0ABR1YLB3_9PEZI